MKDNEKAFLRLKSSLIDDKVVNSESLIRLLASEILNAVEDFVEVDKALSKVELDFSQNDITIKATIKARQIKRLGVNIV